MKKKLMSLFLVGAMAATMLTGCGSGSDGAAADAGESNADADNAQTASGKIAMITDSGDITDESFNQITWETCKAYGEANGIEVEYYKPAEDANEERIAAIDLAIKEGATVVVMPGYLFGVAIAEEQSEYPDVSFIAVDVTEGDVKTLADEEVGVNDNVYICSFQEEQAGYLAGYAAVKDGYTRLGFLGGMAVPAVIRYGYGYIQGIDAAAEELGVDVDVKYFYGGQFNGDPTITAKMEGWYADGTEIVFACGGGIYTSAAEAAAKYDGKVIGVDVDQRTAIDEAAKKEGVCVTSAMKGLSSAVTSSLDAYFNGNWATIGGKSEQLGLTQGDYLGLPTDTASWGFTTFTTAEYEEILNGIKDGSIAISNDTENQPQVGSHTSVSYVE